MIVKVQRSISPPGLMMVYGENRRVLFHGPLSPEVAELLGTRPKTYVRGRLDGDGTFIFEQEVDDQSW
jgi:hypothetical protein